MALRSFRLPDDLMARVVAEAAQLDRSPNWVVRRAVEEHLGRPDRVAPSSPPSAELRSAPKPFAVCRHGVPDCRICQTGRWAR